MLLLAALAQAEVPAGCHYAYTVWNAVERRTRRSVAVALDRAEAPVGALGCTPCREDQVTVELANGLPLRLCHAVAERARDALDRALADGAVIGSIAGYRASMSRGPTDASGDRTELSDHAFGAALDVDEQQNGLYERCVVWGPRCRLIRGGPWVPGGAGSLTADGPVVRAMKAAGFAWGGELAGRQKDFMHFWIAP